MKSEKLDLEFLFRSKQKRLSKSFHDDLKNQDSLPETDDSLILRNTADEAVGEMHKDNAPDRNKAIEIDKEQPPELLDFDINDTTMDVAFLLNKKQAKSEPEAGKRLNDEEDDTLILPLEFLKEQPGGEIRLANGEDENSEDYKADDDLQIPDVTGNDIKLDKIAVDNQLELLIREIENAVSDTDEMPADAETLSELNETDNQEKFRFVLENETGEQQSKEEINSFIDVIQPEPPAIKEDKPSGSKSIFSNKPDRDKLQALFSDEDKINSDFKIESSDDTQTESDLDNAIDLDNILPAADVEGKKEAASLPEEQTVANAQETSSKATSIFAGFIQEKQEEFKNKKPESGKEGKNKHRRADRRRKFTVPISVSSFFENSRLLGLDLGGHSVKYVHLKKSAGSLRLINCGHFLTPEMDSETSNDERNRQLAGVLDKNFNIRNFKNTLITTAVSGMEVVFKNVQVPNIGRKELVKAVPWACRKDFPFPLEATAFEFLNITDKEHQDTGKMDMFVVAAQKELIKKHLDIVGQARITPAKISTVPVALWNVFLHCVKKDQTKCYAIIDIGANSSHMVFIHKGQLQFAREISTASSDFTRALAGALFVEGQEIQLSNEQAEKIKTTYGFPQEKDELKTDEGIPLQEVSVMMGPILERLVKDIQRTIDFYKEKFHVKALDKIFLTGGGALMKNLPSLLSSELLQTIQILNPFDSITIKKTNNSAKIIKLGPKFAVAVGLALDRVKQLNLLPAELKSSYAIQYLKRIYKYVFVIFMLCMFLLSQDISRKIHQIEQEFKRVNREFKSGEPKRMQFLNLQKLLENLNAVKSRIGNSYIADVHAVDYLKVISQIVPVNMTLTSIRVVQRHSQADDKKDDVQVQEFVIIDGIAFENNSMEGMNLATLLMNLENADYFKSMSLTSQQIRPDGSLQFTIECKP